MTTSTPSGRNDGPLRRVWFPLRSNLPHAGRPDIGVEARAKLLALLADELLFEPGLLDVTVTEAGAASSWVPPGSVDEEGYRRRRLAGMRVGEPVVVAWTPEGDEVTSPLVGADVLEYHTLLRDSGLEDAPWAGWAGEEEDARADAATPRLPLVDEHRTTAEQLGADLARDLEVGARLGAAVCVDGARRPLLKTMARVPFPDAARLPWPEVVALRDDPAISELRDAANRYAREQTGPRGAAPSDAADRLDEAVRRARGRAGRSALPDAVVELAADAPPGAGRGAAPDAPGPAAVLVLGPSPARRA